MSNENEKLMKEDKFWNRYYALKREIPEVCDGCIVLFDILSQQGLLDIQRVKEIASLIREGHEETRKEREIEEILEQIPILEDNLRQKNKRLADLE